MSNKFRALSGVSSIFILLGLTRVGIAISRDCYLVTWVHPVPFAIAGAIPVVALGAFLFSDTRKPLESTLAYVSRNTLPFGMLGFMLVWVWIDSHERWSQTRPTKTS